jgi:hypothetical protein
MEDTIFDISVMYDGKEHKGWANPSDELGDDGHPVSFHVVLDGVSFGYLSFNECNWSVNEDRPKVLVKAIGKEIEKHYML